MSRGGYAPLPVSHESPSSRADDEMDGAFESDEDDHDDIPLAHLPVPSSGGAVEQTQTETAQPSQGMYDFEREYDRPPPGSPPVAYGNSNGIVPSSLSLPSSEGGLNNHGPRPSFFRKAIGALLPQHYARVPVSETEIPGRGSGIQNDGVFSNVSARPSAPRVMQDENGDVYELPEYAQKDALPSYAAAQADAVPPYWETTVHAPASAGLDDMLIEGLPAGSVFSFAWNFLISVSFQFVGFMLTYILHTSHAAKYGSRAGLGVTLIQYGLLYRARRSDIYRHDSDGEVGSTVVGGQEAASLAQRGLHALSPKYWTLASDEQDDTSVVVPNSAVDDLIPFCLMTIGWILLLSSAFGFARVKRWERSMRTPTPPVVLTAQDVQRDEEIRARLLDAFGVDVVEEAEVVPDRPTPSDGLGQNRGPNAAIIAAREERLRRDLSAMGLV